MNVHFFATLFFDSFKKNLFGDNFNAISISYKKTVLAIFKGNFALESALH